MKLNKAEFKFLITFIPLITAWFFTYHYIYKIDELLDLNTDLLTKFSELLSYQSNFILSIFNFDTSTEIHGDIVISKILNFTDSHGVWIGEPCNGIKIFGLFSIFIISFKGELKRKILYISFGVLVLHLLNILRISILTYISAINPFLLDFNHNVTFQLIIYGAMLCLWYIWITKFSLKKAA